MKKALDLMLAFCLFVGLVAVLAGGLLWISGKIDAAPASYIFIAGIILTALTLIVEKMVIKPGREPREKTGDSLILSGIFLLILGAVLRGFLLPAAILVGPVALIAGIVIKVRSRKKQA